MLLILNHTLSYNFCVYIDKMPKVQKVKLGHRKLIHPNSRKAATLNRDGKHQTRVDGSRRQKSLKQDAVLERYLWFQSNIDHTKDVYMKADLTSLALEYMKRFEDELEQISIMKSIGCRSKNKPQHSSRLDSIKFTQDKEHNEFISIGLEVPNLTKKSNFELFKEWEGEMQYFVNIEKIKINQKDVDKLSFPEK